MGSIGMKHINISGSVLADTGGTSKSNANNTQSTPTGVPKLATSTNTPSTSSSETESSNDAEGVEKLVINSYGHSFNFRYGAWSQPTVVRPVDTFQRVLLITILLMYALWLIPSWSVISIWLSFSTFIFTFVSGVVVAVYINRAISDYGFFAKENRVTDDNCNFRGIHRKDYYVDGTVGDWIMEVSEPRNLRLANHENVAPDRKDSDHPVFAELADYHCVRYILEKPEPSLFSFLKLHRNRVIRQVMNFTVNLTLLSVLSSNRQNILRGKNFTESWNVLSLYADSQDDVPMPLNYSDASLSLPTATVLMAYMQMNRKYHPSLGGVDAVRCEF